MSLKTPFYIFILGIGVAILCAGCATPTGTPREPTGKITVVGSTALQPLVTAAAALFHQQYAQATVAVQGAEVFMGLKR